MNHTCVFGVYIVICYYYIIYHGWGSFAYYNIKTHHWVDVKVCIGFVVDICLWNNDKWQNGKNSLLIWKGSVFLSAQLWIVLLQVQLPFLQSVGELLVVCLGQSNGLDQSEVSIVVTWPVSTNHSSPGPPSRSWLSRRRRLGGRGGRWRGARWRGPAWSPALPWSTQKTGRQTWQGLKI